MASRMEKIVFAVLFSVGVFFLGSIVYAWTSPASNPPNGNVSAPINAGSGSQTKSGALTVTQLTASIANGTAPLVVTSQTKVANLNADLLDGLDASGFGDATAANQTTILGRIGANNDAASYASTLFGGQQQIGDYIGTPSDGANLASTLFAGQQYLWDNRSSFGSSISTPLLWFGSNSCGSEGCNTSINCPAGMVVAAGCRSDGGSCGSLSVLGSSCVGATSCSQTDGGDGSSDAFVGVLCTR